MAMKQEQHQIKGMQRDLTVSKFSPEYAYENMNIRITARENNTLMSVTNEKGTKEVNLSIDREPLEVHYGKPQSSYEVWTDKPVESDVTGYILVRDLEEIVHKYNFTISKGKSSTRLITAHLGETLEGLFFNTKEPVYDDVYQYYSDTQPSQIIYIDDIVGVPLGTCVLNKYIIVFTKDLQNNVDYIYRIYKQDAIFKILLLYKGDLSFNVEYPIQTLGAYENESIQKVYWVDGVNPPRIINIATNKTYNKDTQFNFIKHVLQEEIVSVTKITDGSGSFPSGVIQYAISYYIKNAQESSIVYSSPLYYISPSNRGGSPEEIFSNSFRIQIKNPDSSFDGINIYSIQRTSIDAMPSVKLVSSLPITKGTEIVDTGDVMETSIGIISVRDINDLRVIYNNEFHFLHEYEYTLDSKNQKVYSFNSDFSITSFAQDSLGKYIYGYRYTGLEYELVVRESDDVYWIEIKAKSGFLSMYSIYISNTKTISYTDNNTRGATIEPSELLYKGGEEIIPYTIAQKDNTLFLGNLTINRASISEELRAEIQNLVVNTDIREEYVKVTDDEDKYYPYRGYYSMPSSKITTFKYGEVYRLGVVALHKSGKWSEAIPVNDVLMNLPVKIVDYDKYYFQKFEVEITQSVSKKLASLGYVAIKPVIVFPTINDRNIIAQGIVCPTIYEDSERRNSTVYGRSSWFARPRIVCSDRLGNNNLSNLIATRTGERVSSSATIGAEIQTPCICVVDDNLFTFHSPEVELDSNISSVLSSCKLKYVGYANCYGCLVDYTISASDRFRTNKTGGVAYKTIQHNYSKRIDYKNDYFVAPQGHLRQSTLNVWQDGMVATHDKGGVGTNINMDDNTAAVFPIFPWHRSTSLNNDNRGEGGSSVLKTKTMSNLLYTDPVYFSYNDIYETHVPNDSYRTGLADLKLFNSNELSAVILNTPENSSESQGAVYYGNTDMVMSATREYYLTYVTGTKVYGPTWNWLDRDYYSMYSDIGAIPENSNPPFYTKYTSDSTRISYKSTPHIVGRFNNSLLGEKVGLPSVSLYDGTIGVSRLTTPGPIETTVDIAATSIPSLSSLVEGNYYMDAVSVYTSYYGTLYKVINGKLVNVATKNTIDVDITYKTKYTIAGTGDYRIIKKSGDSKVTLTPIDSIFAYCKDSIASIIPQEAKPYSRGLFLMADLYRDSVENRFGGTSDAAYSNNIWLPAGDTMKLNVAAHGSFLSYTEGDTFFQRYDCLKTYPYNDSSKNNIVEIVSFMCETRVNIDGRYDRNRGKQNNLRMTPQNFNLFNPVYSQINNFFSFNYLDLDTTKTNIFPNSVTWTSEKTNGGITDPWTNISMASILDMDGDKGKITALQTLNNEIYCFQEQGISNIIFNPRVQIPVGDGVPIEIGNSYKVQGKRYISNIIGCSNKWSLCQTPNGIYFIDDLTNGMYMFDGQSISSLSDKLGFRQFIGANNSTELWNPRDFGNFRTFYDKTNDDIYFINDKYCLTYSELIGQFTSFMSYEQTPIMFNYMDKFYAINQYTDKSRVINKNKLWEINGGDYNMFFGQFKPYYVTIVANQDEPIDKIFNTIEYRADIKRDGVLMPNETFTQLDVWNEYQHGTLELVNKIGHPSSLKRKFRVWRANIPRDNDNRNRIRNTWAYVKLQMNKENTDSMELHDINVGFYE